MKLSWFLTLLLLVFVAVFSVQNAEPMVVRLVTWEVTMSAALVIQLAALLGGLIGFTAGFCSRRPRGPASDPAVNLPPGSGPEAGSGSGPGTTSEDARLL